MRRDGAGGRGVVGGQRGKERNRTVKRRRDGKVHKPLPMTEIEPMRGRKRPNTEILHYTAIPAAYGKNGPG